MRTKRFSRPRIFRSRFVAVFAALGMLLLSMGGVTLAATTASADHNGRPGNHGNAPDVDVPGVGQGGAIHKSYVCKYVRTPGGDEELLQTGQNPIWVDNHSLIGEHAPVQVGDTFQDRHIKSVVIVANTERLSPEPGIESCPGGEDGDEQDVSVTVSPASVCVGNAVRFTVTNTGDITTLYDGRLTAPNGSTLTSFNNVSLPENGTYPVDYTLTSVGSYTLTFWVDGNTGISDSATARATECPDGQVDVSVTPTNVCVGQQVVFTLKNTGSESTTYVGEFTSPGAAAASLGTHTLAGGASRTFTYTANSVGLYSVKFWVAGNTAISDTATATARVCPDLPERPNALVDRDVERQESCPGGIERRTITVTTEYVWNGTAWVLGTPSAPVVSDWVKVRNLTAAERDELNCDEVLPTEGVDLCPNLDGVQESVPPGRSIDEDGNCVRGEVKGTETASPTPNPPVVAPPVDGPGVLPTAVDAGFGGLADTGTGSMTAVMAQLMMGAGLLFLIAAGWLQRGRQTRGVHQF